MNGFIVYTEEQGNALGELNSLAQGREWTTSPTAAFTNGCHRNFNLFGKFNFSFVDILLLISNQQGHFKQVGFRDKITKIFRGGVFTKRYTHTKLLISRSLSGADLAVACQEEKEEKNVSNQIVNFQTNNWIYKIGKLSEHVRCCFQEHRIVNSDL